MTSFRPPDPLRCPVCEGTSLDDRRPPDPLMPPGRDWSDGWNSARSLMPPVGLCPHCRQRFWFDDVRQHQGRWPDRPWRALHVGAEPLRVLRLRQSDWHAEVRELEASLGGELAPIGTTGSSHVPRAFDEDGAPHWQDLVRTVPASAAAALPDTVRRTLDRRTEAARYWLWIDNHVDRNDRLDRHRHRFELEEPEATSPQAPEARRRTLAILIDSALRQESRRSRLQAAEYMREGGWFQAASRCLADFEPQREDLREWADHTRTLALLGMHQVVPRILWAQPPNA